MNKNNILYVLFGGLLIISWSVFFYYSLHPDIPYISIPKNISNRGLFGDMYGVVNSFVTTLAFLFIVINFFEQRKQMDIMQKDLKIMRKDVGLTETAIKLTKEEIEIQQGLTKKHSDHMTKQSFESSFFNFLSLHNDILNSMKFKGGSHITGRDCFEPYIHELKRFYPGYFKENADLSIIERHRIAAEKSYYELFRQYEGNLGHYCRRLYNIIDYIDNSSILAKPDITNENKSKKYIINPYTYTKIVRSQLSSNEINILFYNCLTTHGKGFVKYMEKYRLLKGISRDVLIAPEHWDIGLDKGLILEDY